MKNKSKYYYKDGSVLDYRHDSCYGKLHRVDGPAIEWTDGYKEWHIDGKRHRVNGPAVEWADGSKEWWVDGNLHRVDGPAIEYADGDKAWYIDGKYLTEEEFNIYSEKKYNASTKDTILLIPDMISIYADHLSHPNNKHKLCKILLEYIQLQHK